MSEYDLQFQADLEKAQALSLESLALEQFRRQRKIGSLGVSEDNNGSSREDSFRDAPPPALPPPPRRSSRPRVTLPDTCKSTGASPTRDETNDLISFSSPTSKSAPAPQDAAHASLKEYIDQISKLGQQQTEDSSAKTPDQSPSTMNNHYYNQPPGYYAPYGYHYPPYMAPYPPSPAAYGIPTAATPMPMPYGFYPPNIAGQVDAAQPYPPATPPVYVPYNQTRMAAPSTSYVPFHAAPNHAPPPYNFSTTNLISRPTRPMLYPQLSQVHTYPGTAGNSGQATVPHKNGVSVKKEPSRNSVESNASRKSSEAGIENAESNDTLSGLPGTSNLIDFGKQTRAGSVRVSVLEAFDPLLLTDPGNVEYAAPSECSSVYEEYDPLEFLYGETEMRDAPIYATISKKENVVLPSPPPKSLPSVPAVPNRATTNKLYDSIVKINTKNYSSEHKAFLKMVLDVRKKHLYTDENTNPGYIISPRSGGKYPPNTSIKIVVHLPHVDEPITFTSDVESTVDHVILTVVCSLEENIQEDMSNYILRVWGANEYLCRGSSLSEYDYVRECVRLEKDVRLCLREGKDQSLARSERDDARDLHLTLDDLIPNEPSSLSFDTLSILFETLEGELSRAIGVISAEGSCSPMGVFQAVKAICALAGGIETLHITHTLNAFAQACTAHNQSKAVTPEIIGDSGQYSSVQIRRATARESVASQCGRVRDAVRALVALYCRSHLVDLALANSHYLTPHDVNKAVPSHSIGESTLVCIEACHSLAGAGAGVGAGAGGWRHDEYAASLQLQHGSRPLARARSSPWAALDAAGFYPRVIFDTWLNLEDVPINTLPRESRLVLTIFGRTKRPQDAQKDANNESNPQNEEEEETFQQEELGWCALNMYDFDGMLASGNYILPIWPPCADKRLGPAPDLMHAPTGTYPVVNIEIPLYAHNGVRWSSSPNAGSDKEPTELPSFDSLDGHTQAQLLHLIEQGSYQKMPSECREIMWEKRQYLVQLPRALPLVLLTATNWYGEHREQLISLLHIWEKPSPLNAIHLLLPCFPDSVVREYATALISSLSDDALCRVLPQLVQAYRHDSCAASPLAALLLARALRAPRLAHALHWLLAHYCTQASNQESLGISVEEAGAGGGWAGGCAGAGARRLQLLARAMRAGGAALTHNLARQHDLVKMLSDVAHSVKTAKDGNRQRALTASVQELANFVRSEPTSLPLGLAKLVHDVDIKSCTYFSSNTLPLKINFIGMDNAVIPAMFKVGDDLRQDALVLQIMRVMDSLWLKAGLDLRMVTFQALPTDLRKGMIEIVTEAETLRAIQTEWGLTGSFKDKPIAEWLAKHNPSELEYQRARDNFTASCAGYSVATYLLGVCDRHNDNIMLKTSGHLFHIDFGKFLGDAQMFGNFKRDRAPFVLTHDMVYVINGGERPTQRFHHFVELCCMAFNVVRTHSSHILDLIALMATVGVPGVTTAAVAYVRAALLPSASSAEAAAAFARLIHSSLKSKFTPINFFLHNLAQLRASGDQSSNTSELLSFMPRTYTMAQEGRLVSVECLGYEKRYDPEKHYVYALRIYRQGQTTPSVLYRSYKHFTELYQKICVHFPLAKVHSLPSGLHVGRSNIRQVAERRFGDVQAFLTSLFNLADEIAHSDLVYTFFHPLLRDQQDIEPQRNKNRAEAEEAENNSGSGSLKLSVQYAGGVLSVLILHAQALALTPQGLPPNPYVKVYLVPDPTKETKRKTRVLKRNSHPSFMEMLEYRLPLDIVNSRSLQATVWHYDSLQENQFLGGVVIPLHTLSLREETLAWYPLEYIPR